MAEMRQKSDISDEECAFVQYFDLLEEIRMALISDNADNAGDDQTEVGANGSGDWPPRGPLFLLSCIPY